MSKNKSKAVVDKVAEPVTTAQVTTAQVTEQPTPQASNHTLTYRKNHPGNRCSFGIPGVPGIVVFDLKLFANGKPPATIVLDCDLALPVAKASKPVAA
jgi:hypothetical protein